jgi:hypothetical protein
VSATTEPEHPNYKTVPKESTRLRIGRATANWGPRIYGPPTIVASAPVDAIEDILAVILEARKQICREEK